MNTTTRSGRGRGQTVSANHIRLPFTRANVAIEVTAPLKDPRLGATTMQKLGMLIVLSFLRGALPAGVYINRRKTEVLSM